MIQFLGGFMRGMGTVLLASAVLALSTQALVADGPGDPGGISPDCSSVVCENVCKNASSKPKCCTDTHGQCSTCKCIWAGSLKYCETGCPDD